MTRYVLTRLLAALPVLLAVSIFAFGLQALAPGDPAELLVEASGISPAPPEAVAAKRAELHLDDPIPVQYVNWLSNVLRGDLGRSYRSYRPVAELYLEHLPITATLAGLATAISGIVAVTLGMLAAYRRTRLPDVLAQVVVVTGAAIPGFWLALVLVLVFAVLLRWLPASGSLTPQGLVLPVAVLAIQNLSVVTRLTRASTLDTLGCEFVSVARAKGLSEPAIARRHVWPNVLAPVLTQVGVEFAGLMTGGAIVEYVFGMPGIGRLAIDAALARDMPVVVGFAVAAGVVFVAVNFAVDVLVAALDPRIRSV